MIAPARTLPAEEAGLLAEIHAAPDDDTLRRIYADWLDDHGESDFADFIRTALHAESLRYYDPARTALVAQLAESGKTHGARWLGEKTYRLNFHGYFCRGLPRVSSWLYPSSPPWAFRSQMEAAPPGDVPLRGVLEVKLTVSPGRGEGANAATCWFDPRTSFDDPAYHRAYSIDLDFRPWEEGGYRLVYSAAAEVIRRLAASPVLDPERTRKIGIWRAQKRVSALAERLLKPRFEVVVYAHD